MKTWRQWLEQRVVIATLGREVAAKFDWPNLVHWGDGIFDGWLFTVPRPPGSGGIRKRIKLPWWTLPRWASEIDAIYCWWGARWWQHLWESAVWRTYRRLILLGVWSIRRGGLVADGHWQWPLITHKTAEARTTAELIRAADEYSARTADVAMLPPAPIVLPAGYPLPSPPNTQEP